jgi:hypothetical protein
MHQPPQSLPKRPLERGNNMAASYEKGKYTESKDKKKDAKMTKGLTPAEKKEFEKKDKAHKKPKTMAEDKQKDAKIIKGIKSKRK